MVLRQKFIDERERLGLTQEQLAVKSGIGQSQVSKYEDLSVVMTNPSARVLFQIIERGFERSLAEFFSEIESSASGVKAAERATMVTHADSVPATISASELEKFARTIGRSIGREIRPQLTGRQSPKARTRRAKRR